jgi:DNA transposition AAA+ family ATPase
MTATELKNHPIVQRLAYIQSSLGLKEIPFAKQFRLGMHGANWGKILKGTYDGSFQKALVKLQLALENYENPGSGETEEGIVILRHVREACDAMAIASAAEDEHRLVVIAGLRGSGKSRTMQLVAHKFPGHHMEALPSWAGGYLNFLNKFAEGIGVQAHRSAGDAETAILENLITNPRPIYIDEFNYFSPAGINFLKAVINKTRCPIMTATVPHYLSRMAADHRTAQESAQLLRRAVAIIHIPAVTEREVIQIQRALFPDLEFAAGNAGEIAKAANRTSRLDSVCAILADAESAADIPTSIARHDRAFKVTLKPGEE